MSKIDKKQLVRDDSHHGSVNMGGPSLSPTPDDSDFTASVDQDLNADAPSTERSVAENYSNAPESVEETLGIMLQTQDPHGMGEEMSNNQALMNLMKGNIGTGLLAMPSVVKYSGLWMGIAFIAGTGAIATYLMRLLLLCARDIRERHGIERSKMDYTETVFQVFKYGPAPLRKYKGKIKHTVNGFLIITQVGFCCVYILFIAQNIHKFLEHFWPSVDYNDKLIGFLVALFLIPLSLIKNLTIFAYFSIAANIATVVGLVMIFIYCFLDLQPWAEFPGVKPMSDQLIAFGIIVYSFEAISLVLPIENKMKDPDAYVSYSGVLNTSMALVVILYVSMGFFGFLRFGEDTEASITYSIPYDPYWVLPVKPIFVFAILISYLLQFYVPAHIFGRLMEKFRCHREASDRRRAIHINVMRVILVLFTYTFAVLVPDLDLMISLIGSLSSSMLALILPPILDLVNNWQIRHSLPRFWLRCLINGLCITFGFVGFIGGTLATIVQIVKKHTGEGE